MNSESHLFALYQQHAEVAFRHYDGGLWQLMRVKLVKSNLSEGIHELSYATIVGVSTKIPAEFESGHLLFSHRSESNQVITDIQSVLGISADKIIHALGSNMIVVYSYSDLQS